mmetsp:Transcript_61516/g.150569  ORF Transcript_61516/g.150569 Transcript_61516/m.150569 type:complete len:140 (+) Transcript_61516:760-1179(+)
MNAHVKSWIVSCASSSLGDTVMILKMIANARIATPAFKTVDIVCRGIDLTGHDVKKRFGPTPHEIYAMAKKTGFHPGSFSCAYAQAAKNNADPNAYTFDKTLLALSAGVVLLDTMTSWVDGGGLYGEGMDYELCGHTCS